MRSVYYLTFIHMSNKPIEGGENAKIVEQSRFELMQDKFQEVMDLAQTVRHLANKVGDHHLGQSGTFAVIPRF